MAHSKAWSALRSEAKCMVQNTSQKLSIKKRQRRRRKIHSKYFSRPGWDRGQLFVQGVILPGPTLRVAAHVAPNLRPGPHNYADQRGRTSAHGGGKP